MPSGKVSIPVSAPMDPNEIVGTKGYDALGDTVQWVAATQSLPYTIYFENDPDMATAAAQKVEIRCPLHAKADLSTFAVGAFGFGSHVFPVEGIRSTYQQRLDLVEDMGIYVDMVAGIDIISNEAFWIFQSIDSATGLPPQGIQQGFLPINDENHGGEGFVSFTIKPKSGNCITGDVLTAEASIVFDINEAIPTNVWYNTVDALPPTTQLTGTELEDNRLLLEFAGQDDEGGCGIKQYKLYVSDNYGAYSLFDTYLAGETASYSTEYDHCYRFFCLGEDHVGNVEAMKDEADLEYGNYNLSVVALADPEEAGTVTGSGTYVYQSVVTVNAIANPGFEFVQWTLRGVPVSNGPIYSFTITEPMELVAHFALAGMTTADLNLAPGWNWWSSYLEMEASVEEALKDAIAAENTAATIKSMTGNIMLENGAWSTGVTLNNESMFMVLVENSVTATLTGGRADPTQHTITLNPGWNWIGFPSVQSMLLSEALAGITPNEEDVIKGSANNATYTAEYGWNGSLTDLTPGLGYMYLNGGTSALTLTYPATSKGFVRSLPMERYWTNDTHRFATNMVMLATLDADRFAMAAGNYEIGAFVGDECRGSARLQQVGSHYIAYLTIGGENAEMVRFRLYDVANGMELGLAEEQVTYVANAVTGTTYEPVVLHFLTTGVEEEGSRLSVYPNPAKDKLTLEGLPMRSVSLYNVMGQLVLTKEGAASDHVEIEMRPLVAGVYTVAVRTVHGTVVNRLVVKE